MGRSFEFSTKTGFDQIDPTSFREVPLKKVKIKLSPLKNLRTELYCLMNISKHVMYFICKKIDQNSM
jgi:hypothetical protein